jgi:gliding motility-associated-like protein
MPTAFTPNNDNLNDYYYPLTRGIKTIVRFSIYDRFGKLVYEARNFPPNDKSFGWNGKINTMDQSTSVFVYYIEALCDVGEKLYKKGSVVLIR